MRTVPLTLAPTVTYPLWDILPLLFFDTNVVSATTGDIMTDPALTTSVEHAIPLDMSLMTVLLNIFPPLSCLQSLEVSNSFVSRRLVIELGA